MLCDGIFCSGHNCHTEKLQTCKSMEISLTALEIVLLLLNNYFLVRSKNLRLVYNVFPFEQESFQVHIAQRVPNAIRICSFFRKSSPYTPLHLATAVQGALQQNSNKQLPSFQCLRSKELIPMIRCCKLFEIKKLGLKAFFHGIQ